MFIPNLAEQSAAPLFKRATATCRRNLKAMRSAGFCPRSRTCRVARPWRTAASIELRRRTARRNRAGRARQAHPERRAVLRIRLDVDLAAVGPHDLLDDEEAEPEAVGRLVLGDAAPEGLED